MTAAALIEALTAWQAVDGLLTFCSPPASCVAVRHWLAREVTRYPASQRNVFRVISPPVGATPGRAAFLKNIAPTHHGF